MAVIQKPHTFQNLTKSDAPQVNANFDAIINEMNGNLDGGNIKTVPTSKFDKTLKYAATDDLGMTTAYSTGTSKISTTVGEVLYTTSFTKAAGVVRIRVKVLCTSLNSSSMPVSGNNSNAALYINDNLIIAFTSPGTGTTFDYTYNLERTGAPLFADGDTLTVQLRTNYLNEGGYKIATQDFFVYTNQILPVKAL